MSVVSAGPRSHCIAALALLALASSACGSRSCERGQKRSQPATQALEPLPPVHPTPVPPTISFQSVRIPEGVALPAGCALLAPVWRARLEVTNLRFAASAEAPGELAIAYSQPDTGVPLLAHGIVAIQPNPIPRDLAWFDESAPALFSATAQGWLGLSDLPADPGGRQVVLVREGGGLERIAIGDQLRAVDLACTGTVCGALTTFASSVASPGASLWIGTGQSPVATWRRIDMASDRRGSRPVGIATLSPARVLIADDKELLSWDAEGARAEQTRPVRYGMLDAAWLGPTFVAATLATPIDDRGCSPGGQQIVLDAGQGAEFSLNVPTSPSSALLRPISAGGLLAWLAPVNCLTRDRWIVHAVRLDPVGRPLGDALPVADAKGFALWSREDEVGMVLAQPQWLTVLRMRCGEGT